MKKQQHNLPKGRLTPSASSICLQTGRGRIEGVPRGKDSKRAPVSVVLSSPSLQAQKETAPAGGLPLT